MKSILIALLLTQVASAKTHFETLTDMYKQSGAILVTEILGAWSGRCFDYKNQNNPIASAYSFKESENLSGPLFSDINYEVKTVLYHNVRADYYDDHSADEISKGEHIRLYRENTGALTHYYNGRTRVEIRKTVDYLISEVYENGKGTQLMCYYFLKLK